MRVYRYEVQKGSDTISGVKRSSRLARFRSACPLTSLPRRFRPVESTRKARFGGHPPKRDRNIREGAGQVRPRRASERDRVRESFMAMSARSGCHLKIRREVL